VSVKRIDDGPTPKLVDAAQYEKKTRSITAEKSVLPDGFILLTISVLYYKKRMTAFLRPILAGFIKLFG